MPVAITQSLIDRALKDVAGDRQRRELMDLRTPGLFLRVQPRGSKWGWRAEVSGRTIRLDLGPLDEWSIAEARIVANAATALVKSRLGIPGPEWLHAQRAKHGKLAPGSERMTTNAREFLQWGFTEARKAYLEEVRRTLREATFDDYRHMLNIPELVELNTQKVGKIDRQQLASIVAGVHRSGRERYAGKLADTLRPFWKWLGEDAQQKRSGVEPGIMERLRPPKNSRRDDDDEVEASKYVPSVGEVGRILAMSANSAFDPQIGTAVALVCYAVQRRRAVVAARTREFVAVGDGSEGLWRMPPAHRKTADRRGDRRSHVVPLTAGIWSRIKAQIARTGDSEWLFPQFRPKRFGDQVTHMNSSVLTRAFLLMPEVRASPHDLRRAFSTGGTEMFGWDLAKPKLILDHNEGVASGDVTRDSYQLSDMLDAKWPMMRAWAAAIEAAAAAATNKEATLADVAWLKRQIDQARYGKD